MRTDLVFDSGSRIRRIGLGTMRMADRPDQRGGIAAPIWAPPTDRAELIGFLRGAAEAGVRMFETSAVDPRTAEIAAAHGVSTARLALAWLLHRGDHVTAIPGTTDPAHLQDNLVAADIELTADEMKTLDSPLAQQETR